MSDLEDSLNPEKIKGISQDDVIDIRKTNNLTKNQVLTIDQLTEMAIFHKDLDFRRQAVTKLKTFFGSIGYRLHKGFVADYQTFLLVSKNNQGYLLYINDLEPKSYNVTKDSHFIVKY